MSNFVHGLGATAVIVGGVGGGAMNGLAARGIEVIAGVSGNAGEVLKAYAAGRLISGDPDCHGHHGGHDEGEHDGSLRAPGAAGHSPSAEQRVPQLDEREAQQQKMAAVAQASEQRGEAHRRKMEEMNTPSPPLDGNALGQALLKNLGVPVDRGATAARPAVSDGTSRNLAVPGDRTSTGRRTIVRG